MPVCVLLPSSCRRVFSSSGERVGSQWESRLSCALCACDEACFYSLGKKGIEVTLACLVSPYYCCDRFGLSLAGSETNIKMCMTWKLSASSQSPGQYRSAIYWPVLCSIFHPTVTHRYPQPLFCPHGSCGSPGTTDRAEINAGALQHQEFSCPVAPSCLVCASAAQSCCGCSSAGFQPGSRTLEVHFIQSHLLGCSPLGEKASNAKGSPEP